MLLLIYEISFLLFNYMFLIWNKVKGNEIYFLKVEYFKVFGNKYKKLR